MFGGLFYIGIYLLLILKLMEIPEGKVKELLVSWIDSSDARPVDEEQRDLTEEFLVPDLEAITKELAQFRKEFDKRIKDVLKKMMADLHPQYSKDPALRNPKNYPIGFCDTIANGVWAEVLRNIRFPTTPGMRALSHFSGRGGHLKKIAGIQHGKHFQNALQAGSLFVDVANDTIDKSKPPIEICELSESGFSNMGDLSLAANVIEEYWGYKILPQRFFPFLSPFYPIVQVSRDGRVEILPITYGMAAKNALSDFKMAEDFIFRSRFSGEVLPPKIHERIGKSFSWDEDNYDFDSGTPRGDICYRGGAPDDLIAEVFERLRNIDPEHLPRLISGSIGAVRAFNQQRIQL